MKLLLMVNKTSGLTDNFDANRQVRYGYCDNLMQAILLDLGLPQIENGDAIPRGAVAERFGLTPGGSFEGTKLP